jgi:hypothetical protein
MRSMWRERGAACDRFNPAGARATRQDMHTGVLNRCERFAHEPASPWEFGGQIGNSSGVASGTHVAARSATTHAMSFLKRDGDEGFERLQAMLLAMRAGDAVAIGEAVAISGLSERICRRSLEALARVGLLSREGDGRFVRRTLGRVS